MEQTSAQRGDFPHTHADFSEHWASKAGQLSCQTQRQRLLRSGLQRAHHGIVELAQLERVRSTCIPKVTAHLQRPARRRSRAANRQGDTLAPSHKQRVSGLRSLSGAAKSSCIMRSCHIPWSATGTGNRMRDSNSSQVSPVHALQNDYQRLHTWGMG